MSCQLLLMIEILHDFMCQNPRSYGSIVNIKSYKIYIINNRTLEPIPGPVSRNLI